MPLRKDESSTAIPARSCREQAERAAALTRQLLAFVARRQVLQPRAVAILDLIMPKLGGPAVASRLATLFPGVSILFTIGYSQDSESVLPVTVDTH